MNRRSFIKMITGVVGGIVAAFVPGKVKAAVSEVAKLDPSLVGKIDILKHRFCDQEKCGFLPKCKEGLKHVDFKAVEFIIMPCGLRAQFTPTEYTNLPKFPLGTRYGNLVYSQKISKGYRIK